MSHDKPIPPYDPPDKMQRTKRSRRLPGWSARMIRGYAQQTGLAMWAWNSLHADLFLIFWFLIGGGRYETAHGIWHVIQSDAAQRDMLKNTAESELVNDKKTLARILWLLDKATRLGAYRNIAAHTPALFSAFVNTIPSADGGAARNQARVKFNEISHERFWKALAGDLLVLSDYARGIAWGVYHPSLHGNCSPPFFCDAEVGSRQGNESGLTR